jgi:hypothetical protein
MAISRAGHVHQLTGGGRHGKPAIITLGADGSCPLRPFQGPVLGNKNRWAARSFLALSGDERHLYVTGLGGRKGTFPAVYRLKLPERGPATPFFGDPKSPGKGKAQLGEPRGIAVDGKGNLLVADYANNRVVVVSEKDGRYAGEMKVEHPDCVAVDRKSGTVYVSRAIGAGRPGRTKKGQLPGGSCEIVKYSGWKNPKVLARMSIRGVGYAHRGYTMVVDTSARPAVIWAGGRPGLLRIEDLGGKFSDAEKPIRVTGRIEDNSYVDLLVDHVKEQVYARSGKLASGPAGTYQWFRFDERTSKFKTVGGYTTQGSQLGVGPDGTMYLSGYSCNLFKYGADGKASPWTKRNTPPDPKNSRWSPRRANNMYVPVSMCWTNHTMSVGYNGHIYTFESRRSGGRTTKRLCEYLPSGEKVKGDPVIWKVSDACTGPKFDQQGNIYIIDQIKPKGQLYPRELEGVMAGKCVRAKAAIPAMYGGVIKFTPKGGMIESSARHLKSNPFDGPPRLPKGLKIIEAETCTQGRHGSAGRTSPAKVIGAEWVHMGVSHVDICHCNCQTTRFDVDLFGRVWYADLNLFRVGVLDTSGNLITRFGGYGNAESRGPESKDRSLAKPDIAFAWLIGVGATDKYAYMGDCLNRRMLRAKLVYVAEETCAIR